MNTAVYYPLFYPSESWLRMASLLWDRVYLMHTDDTPPMSASLRKLDQALGGVLEIAKPWDTIATSQQEIKVPTEGPKRWDKALHMYVAPTRWENRIEECPVSVEEITKSDETLNQFASWLDLREDLLSKQMEPSQSDMAMLKEGKFGGPVISLLSARGLLQVNHQPRIRRIPSWEMDQHYEAPLQAPEEGSDQAFYEMLTYQAGLEEDGGNSGAATELRATAWEIRRRNEVTVHDTGTTYHLPKDVAFHYLSLCAGRVALTSRRDLVTDRQQFTDAVLSSEVQLRGVVATAVLEAYIPTDLLHIDVQRLAECREKLSVKRLKFQTEIQGLVKTYSEAASIDTYETLKGQLVEIAQERINQTQRTYRRAKFDVSPQALMVSLTPPALATAVESVLQSGVIAPIGLAATLALFAAGKVLDLRQARTNREISPWSYVLDLSKGIH